MLEKLIRHVAEGGIHSYEDLARHLAVSQPLLEMMLEDLARQGYLRAVSGGCDGGCAGCSMGGCSIAGQRHIWMLTEKGTRAVTRLAG
jgi:hypothetical protein